MQSWMSSNLNTVLTHQGKDLLKTVRTHSSLNISELSVHKTGCMTSHEPEQPKWPQIQHTLPLPHCSSHSFGKMHRWHDAFGKSLGTEMDEWRDTGASGLTTAATVAGPAACKCKCRSRTEPPIAFKPPKRLEETCPGSTSDCGASMTKWLPPELNAWSGFEKSSLSVILWQSQRQ